MKKKTRRARKDPNVYPTGWNHRRTKAIADYYDARKDQPLLNESVAAEHGLVWMEVPQELVPQVRRLIARRRKSA